MQFPEWSEERLRELAEAEEEALANSGGLLACSPELWELMNRKDEGDDALDRS